MAKLKLKVVPGASRERIDGWLGDALKLRVRAAPEQGRANAAVEKLLAEALGLPARRVRIVSGFTNAAKLVEIEGLQADEILARLAIPPVRD